MKRALEARGIDVVPSERALEAGVAGAIWEVAE
jgi:hypothetical protein